MTDAYTAWQAKQQPAQPPAPPAPAHIYTASEHAAMMADFPFWLEHQAELAAAVREGRVVADAEGQA